jgi:hypothetical protein
MVEEEERNIAKRRPHLFIRLQTFANGTLRTDDHLFPSDGETKAALRDQFIKTNSPEGFL